MPHKHTRKQVNNGANFDLPPSSIARPLTALNKDKTGKAKKQNGPAKPSKKRKRETKDGYGADDTPRAFARIMQRQNDTRPLSGLDDGDRPRKAKKSKTQAQPDESKKQQEVVEKVEIPKILPGERLADFSARVNQAMPVAGLARKGRVKVEGVKERRTRTEKRLHKLYAEWRKEDVKLKEREEEMAEQAEEAEEEKMAEFGGQNIRLPEGKRGRRKRTIGEIGEMDENPWSVLKHRREAPKGLHDVVQAPPDMKVIPKEKFKVRNGAKVDVANVPAASGSLKKREELSEARREVIERYRAMMKGGKAH